MKKLSVFLTVALVLLGTGIQGSWAAAPKAGGKCTKLGQVISTPGIKYKCIFVGKKLVWDKGIRTAPAPSKNTNPYLIEPAPINSFKDLNSGYRDIKYWAWKKSRNAVDGKDTSNLVIETLVGPSSKECPGKSSVAANSIHNLYAGASLPKRLILIYAVQGDSSWAQLQMEKILGTLPVTNPLQNPHGMNAELDALELQPDCSDTSPMVLSGASLAHGYTHTIQKVQYLGSSFNWGTFPRWLVEGGATYSENFIQYGSDYKTWITNPTFHNWDLKQYDLNFYQDFFTYKLQENNKYSWAHTDQWPNQRVYDVGSYACEVLIAVKGPASIIQLHSEFAKTGDFEKSFEIVYGLPWKEALPLIANAVFQSTTWLVNTPSGLK